MCESEASCVVDIEKYSPENLHVSIEPVAVLRTHNASLRLRNELMYLEKPPFPYTVRNIGHHQLGDVFGYLKFNNPKSTFENPKYHS